MAEVRNLTRRRGVDERRYRLERSAESRFNTARPVTDSATRSGVRRLGEQQPLNLHVIESMDDAATIWRSFERRAVSSPFQSYVWLSHWYLHVGQPAGVNPVLVFGYDEAERLVLMLPLGLTQTKGLKTLAWLGDGVAGYNMPLIDPTLLAEFRPQSVDRIWRDIIAYVGGIDILRLRRQARMLGQHHNPFVNGARPARAGGGRLLRLPPTWPEFVDKHLATSRRTGADCARHLRKRGRLTIGLNLPAQPRSRVIERILAVSRSQAGRQFRRSPLQHPGVGSLFRALAQAESTGFLSVCAVNVGDEMIAGSIGYIHGNRYYLAITSIEASDDGSAAERLLCEELIRSCIVQGVKSIDFLGGTAAVPQWTDKPSPLYENLAGQSLVGRATLGLNWARRVVGREQAEGDLLGGGIRQLYNPNR